MYDTILSKSHRLVHLAELHFGKEKKEKGWAGGGDWGFLAMMSDWMGGWKYIKILLQRGRVCMQIKRTEPGFLLDGVSVELDWDT